MPGGIFRADVLWAGNVQQRDRSQQFLHLHGVRGGNVQFSLGRNQRFDLHGVRSGDIQHHDRGCQSGHVRGLSGGELLPERIGRDNDLLGRLLLPGAIFLADGLPGGNIQLRDRSQQHYHLHGLRRGNV